MNPVSDENAAVVAGAEEVEAFRRLAKAQPDRFRPKLADALLGLGHHLGALSRWEDALAATGEAVALCRTLDDHGPLAEALDDLVQEYCALGRDGEALSVCQEVSTLRRGAEGPHALAPALESLAHRLCRTGRRDAALAYCHKAIALRQEVVESSRGGGLPGLASVLGMQGCLHRKLGRFGDAVQASREALVTLLPNFHSHPHTHARLMGWLVRVHQESAASAGLEPEEALLAPIRRRLAALAAEAGVPSGLAAV